MTNPSSMRARFGWRRLLDLVLVALALTIFVKFFCWTEGTSGGFNPPGEEDYYNFLVRGWRSGHLYMSKEPTAAMKALADPYDPTQNNAARLGDASYFEGHYYLYFSAAPAFVLHWPYHALTGRELGTTTAVAWYALTGFFAASALWLAIRWKYFPAGAPWVGAAGVLMLGLGTNLLVLARRPLVWELPIAAAGAFAMLALLAVFWALHGRRPVLALGVAGFFYGLAIAARPGELFGAVLFLPAVWALRKKAGANGTWWRAGVAAALGMGIWLASVFAHNYARFRDPLEFGVNYQLTSSYESKQRHFTPTYLAHNTGIYLFNAPKWSRSFPFIEATAVRGGPPGYLSNWVEPIAGLAMTFPFLWLALASPLVARKRDGRRETAEELRPMTAVIAAWFAGVFGFFLCFYCATPRYTVEFAPALVLLAGIGALELERRAQTRARKMGFTIGVVVACLVTAFAGTMLSFDYHNRLLRTLGPELWKQMEETSARWLERAGIHK